MDVTNHYKYKIVEIHANGSVLLGPSNCGTEKLTTVYLFAHSFGGGSKANRFRDVIPTIIGFIIDLGKDDLAHEINDIRLFNLWIPNQLLEDLHQFLGFLYVLFLLLEEFQV